MQKSDFIAMQIKRGPSILLQEFINQANLKAVPCGNFNVLEDGSLQLINGNSANKTQTLADANINSPTKSDKSSLVEDTEDSSDSLENTVTKSPPGANDKLSKTGVSAASFKSCPKNNAPPKTNTSNDQHRTDSSNIKSRKKSEMLQNTEESNDLEDIASTSKTKNGICSSNVQSNDLKNIASTSKAKDGVCCSKVQSSQFTRYETVEATLAKSKQGKAIIKAAKNSFSEPDRRAMIRILVAELVEAQNGNHYPPIEAKVALANAIVTEFPLLKAPTELGYEHYYDPLSRKGFLEYRLLTLRTKLKPEEKKRNKKVLSAETFSEKSSRNSSTSLLTGQELNEKINFMNFKSPIPENRKEICKSLSDTFENRRSWIKQKSPSVTEIFEMYPRLIDYGGDMIDAEFNRICPNSGDNFIRKFPSFYMPRILAYVAKYNPDTLKYVEDFDDDSLRAVLMLVYLLPTSNAKSKNKKKNTQEGPIAYVFEMIPDGNDIDIFVQKKRQAKDCNIQQYIIGTKSGESAVQYFVQGDGWILHRRDSSKFIPAFDLLYKLFYCLNLDFPSIVKNLYSFMDQVIYNIPGTKPASIVTSLQINLSNFEDDTEQSSE